MVETLFVGLCGGVRHSARYQKLVGRGQWAVISGQFAESGSSGCRWLTGEAGGTACKIRLELRVGALLPPRCARLDGRMRPSPHIPGASTPMASTHFCAIHTLFGTAYLRPVHRSESFGPLITGHWSLAAGHWGFRWLS